MTIRLAIWAPSLFAIANTRFVVCFRSANVRCEQLFNRANGANVQQNVRCGRCTERTLGLTFSQTTSITEGPHGTAHMKNRSVCFGAN